MDSGTSALRIAIGSSNASFAGPVAIPAYACFDVATAIDGSNATFTFYDLDPITLGPDWESLRSALRNGAQRIVIVHQYGIPVDIDRLNELAREFGALVIEDAAQAVGARWGARPVGGLGSLSVLSFGRGKGLTGGRGGALVANDAAGGSILERVDVLPTLPWRVGAIAAIIAQYMLGRPETYAIPTLMPFLRLGETRYQPVQVPEGPSIVSLRVLVETMSLVGAETETRQRNATRLNANLKRGEFDTVNVCSPGVGGYLRLPVVASVEQVSKMRSRAARRLGIMPAYPRSLSALSEFSSRQVGSAVSCPGAELLSRQLVTLPTHSMLTESDLSSLEQFCCCNGGRA